jgi:hypothetical protein
MSRLFCLREYLSLGKRLSRSQIYTREKPAQEKTTTSMVVSETAEGTSGYGNLLPTVLSVCQSPEWWANTGANIHVCADISLFSSYQCKGTGALLMGN